MAENKQSGLLKRPNSENETFILVDDITYASPMKKVKREFETSERECTEIEEPNEKCVSVGEESQQEVKVQSLKSKIETLQGVVKISPGKVETLQEELSLPQGRSQTLELVRNSQKRLDSSQEQLEISQEELKISQGQIQALEELVSNSQKQLDSSQEQLKISQEELEISQEELSLPQGRSQTLELVRNSQKRLDSSQEQLEISQKQLETSQGRMQTLERRVATLEKESNISMAKHILQKFEGIPFTILVPGSPNALRRACQENVKLLATGRKDLQPSDFTMFKKFRKYFPHNPNFLNFFEEPLTEPTIEISDEEYVQWLCSLFKNLTPQI